MINGTFLLSMIQEKINENNDIIPGQLGCAIKLTLNGMWFYTKNVMKYFIPFDHLEKFHGKPARTFTE
jgi:hypothetical protein